jgi:hypothetical protein
VEVVGRKHLLWPAHEDRSKCGPEGHGAPARAQHHKRLRQRQSSAGSVGKVAQWLHQGTHCPHIRAGRDNDAYAASPQITHRPVQLASGDCCIIAVHDIVSANDDHGDIRAMVCGQDLAHLPGQVTGIRAGSASIRQHDWPATSPRESLSQQCADRVLPSVRTDADGERVPKHGQRQLLTFKLRTEDADGARFLCRLHGTREVAILQLGENHDKADGEQRTGCGTNAVRQASNNARPRH